MERLSVKAAYDIWAETYDECENATRDLDAAVLRVAARPRRLERIARERVGDVAYKHCKEQAAATSQFDGTLYTEQILTLFHDRDVRALFVTEIAGVLGLPERAVDEACAELVAKNALMVVENTFPDPHLAGVNLSIAALICPAGTEVQDHAAARDAARSCWATWLSEFLGSHRCQ